MTNELNTLPDATLKAFEEKEFRKTMPSYQDWFAEHRDNLRYSDNSTAAAAIRRSNGEMRSSADLWNQVLAEAEAAK